MNCPACRQLNPDGSRFCGVCGGLLETVCPGCHHRNSLDSRFCHGCGRGLPGPRLDSRLAAEPRAYTPKHLAEEILKSRASLEGERKQVTVLFADIKDFTDLAAGREPEDLHLLMDEVFAVLLEVVHRYQGTINQFLGDGVMALFGAPLALEDHALRAVKAALEIQETMTTRAAEFRARFGKAPALRVGLNSGRVVVGKIGDDLRMDYTAQGDTVNMAARLQQIADVGTVAMGPTTRRLVGNLVESVSLGQQTVKGRIAPLEVFRAVRALDPDELIDAPAGSGLSPFIGREEEMNRLLELFEEAAGGLPRAAVVMGEVGSGKSRLLLELKRRIALSGPRWVVGHCVPYGRSTPYRPIVKGIRTAFGLPEGASQQGATKALAGLSAELSERAGEVIPVMRYLLGLQPSAAELPAVSGADRRPAITRALDAVIEVLVKRGPLVLVWEDCQWLDQVSAEYLISLVERLPAGPVLCILTYRTEESARPARRPAGEELVLRPLTRQQAKSLVARLSGEQLTPDLLDLAVARAGGNPLFLEELTRTLIESGPESVPPTVEALLRARIERLVPARKLLLETAAVIGQEFSRTLLEQVLEAPQDVSSGLRELVADGFLNESDTSPDLFRFRQPLLQEAAYEGWLSHRRRALHRRIGETIERMYPHQLFPHVEKLARHFTRSEEWERAAHYHRAAGRKAAALCANQEAIQRFERALEMLARLPEGPDRTRESMEVRLDLCSPNLQIGRLDEVVRLCREAEPAAKSLDDQQALADVYAHLSNYHYMKGEPDSATEYGCRCLAISQGADRLSAGYAPRQYLGTCYHVLGRYHDAVTVLRDHIESFERGAEYRRSGPANLSYVSSCGWLAFALTDLGDFTRAHDFSAKGVRAATMSGHAYVQAIASTFAGLVWQAQGALDRAVPILRQSLQACIDRQILVWRPIAGALLGHAYALQGRVPIGLDLLVEAASMADRLQVLAYGSLWSTRLAEAQLVAGEISQALQTAHRAVELAVRHKERGNHARALVVLGTVSLRLESGNLEDGREHLRRGVAEAEELAMRPLQARGYDVLSSLATEQGDAAAAWQWREKSEALCREMGLSRWWEVLLNPPVSARERPPELRRNQRRTRSWPVTVDTGRRRLYLQTTDLSTTGVRVRSREPLQIGTPARLHFQLPTGRPVDVQATVARTDADGVVFAFEGAVDEEFQSSLNAGPPLL